MSPARLRPRNQAVGKTVTLTVSVPAIVAGAKVAGGDITAVDVADIP